MELKPEDRRGRGPAGGGDRERLPKEPGKRIALETPADLRNQQEDRCHGAKGELEAWVEERVRVPGQESDRPEQEDVPAVPRASGETRERGEPACHSRPDDRRLRADREYVARDPGERTEMTEPPGDAEQPAEG